MSQALDLSVALLGLVLVAAGTWLVSPATCFITTGGLLIGAVVLAKLVSRKS